jgi:hypothetical protein
LRLAGAPALLAGLGVVYTGVWGWLGSRAEREIKRIANNKNGQSDFSIEEPN